MSVVDNCTVDTCWSLVGHGVEHDDCISQRRVLLPSWEVQPLSVRRLHFGHPWLLRTCFMCQFMGCVGCVWASVVFFRCIK